MPIDAKSKMEMITNIAVVVSSSLMRQIILLVNLNLLIKQILVGTYFLNAIALKKISFQKFKKKLQKWIKKFHSILPPLPAPPPPPSQGSVL